MDCPACGGPVPDEARFCSSCGREARPVRDERRVVTVLFGDLVGFTSLSERLDPEQVKNLVDHCFERLAADVVAFGGQVDKVIGDAIVALFGAPVAHEDDAERAVRAALRMQETMGDLADVAGHRLELRIGVNTGEVLVGAMRAAGTTTAMGDVVNTASRLQTSAGPGEVLVGPATHSATQAVIDYESRGAIAAKGREEPVPAWAARGALLPPGYRARRIDVPLVGREHELGLLHHAVDTSVAHDRALLALLVGDPGLGKTRLAEEIGDWAGITHGARVLEGRCVPYGEANVWWPIAEALRGSCGVEVDAGEDAARAATTERVAEVYERPAKDPEVQRTVNGLLNLMGYETSKGADPASVREEVVRSLVAFVEQSTLHQPVVLQLSDLHWADELVLDLVREVFERLHHRPAVVIATARPTLLDRWAPGSGRHNTLLVHVDPLGRDASRELLSELLGGAPPPDIAEALLDRSGGNPFFLEELVSLLEGRSAAEGHEPGPPSGSVAELPDTLRGLVAARLDDLSGEVAGVLQDAAVLGRRGSVKALHAMGHELRPQVDVDAAIAELVDKEILRVELDEWEFRSDLVREVAYGMITKADRARRHAGIAKFIEDKVCGPGGSGDLHSSTWVDQLSHHYGVAVELADELGLVGHFPADLRQRARRWITESAKQARSENVLATSIRLYTQALALAGAEPSTERTELLLGRGEAYEEAWQIADARRDAEAARTEAEATDDEHGVARALVLLGEVQQKEGDGDGAAANLRDAAVRFAALGDAEGQGEALRQLGMVDLFRGQLTDAEASVTAAYEAFTRAEAPAGEAWALQNLAWIAFVTGQMDLADHRLQRAVARFSDLGDTRGMAWSLGLLAFVRMQQARIEEAEALGEQVLHEARARGDHWASGMMMLLLGMVRCWTGRTDEAVALTTEARSLFREVGDAYGETQAGAGLGRALAMAGRVDAAFEALEQAADAAARGSAPEMGVIGNVARIATAVQVGEPERADPSLGVVVDHQQVGGAELAVALGMIALQTGDVVTARRRIEDALAAHAEPPAAVLAALAVVDAAEARPGVEALADRVSAQPRATYIDRALADTAAALAAARDGRADAAAARFRAAEERTAATGDQLLCALLGLARASADVHLERPGAAADLALARAALEAMGTTAHGWTTVFDLALRSGSLVS